MHKWIIEAGYKIIFCHREAFLLCDEGLKIFQSSTYRSAVKTVRTAIAAYYLTRERGNCFEHLTNSFV